MTRLFVALELPDQVRKALAGLQSPLPGARWVKAGSMHLTLAFIGEADDARQRAIETALKPIIAAPFSLCLCGLGRFPPRGLPRVLWTGAAPDGEVVALANSIRSALVNVGLTREQRAFKPHVTLARFRQAPPGDDIDRFLNRFSTFATPAVDIDSFHLYSSNLRSSGAKYRIEATFPLKGGPR